MSDLTLKAETPLNNARRHYDNIKIEEVVDRALVSMAIPLDGKSALNSALKTAYDTELPTIGTCATGHASDTVVLGLAQDQFFLMFDDPGGDPAAAIRERVENKAYIVDQSDGWVMVRLSGSNCRTALERICPLDLHPEVFRPGQVARTMMEHLAVIIACEAVDSYLLLSPRSSAPSFLHALDTSARNVS